ncbi:MAG: lipid A-modifier LpxR family protein [Flavobacteriaceae bacterium]
MQRFLIALILWVVAAPLVAAQSYLNLQVDNDLYFRTDFYYSSGIFVDYGYALPQAKKDTCGLKTYAGWKLGQEIYTPSRRYSTDLSRYDYPYSGYLFVQHQREILWPGQQGVKFGVQLGISGKASMAQSLQNLYHRLVLKLPELAWLAAQPQRLHAGFLGSYYKGWSLAKEVVLLQKIHTELTTHRIGAGGQVGLLLGTAPPVPYQDFLLQQNRRSWAIYIGTRQEYRWHDFPIAGSLFDDTAPFVLESNRYRHGFEAGLILNYPKWRLVGIYHSNSKDVDSQRLRRHKYLNLTITRFL